MGNCARAVIRGGAAGLGLARNAQRNIARAALKPRG